MEFQKDDFEFEMINSATLHDTITGLCEGVDTSIQDVTDNKTNLASTMDIVINLVREVECKESAAEQAKLETARSGLDILAKVDKVKQAQQRAKEMNDMHSKEMQAQQVVLATEIEKLQSRVSELLNKGGSSLGVLDEIRKALELRLSSALREKELADKEKLEKESAAQKALAFEERQLEMMAEETERLKEEALKNSKLRQFLVDRGHVVDMLDGDVSDKCKDADLLKESLDQAVMLTGMLSSSQTSSTIASSVSSLTNEMEKEKNSIDQAVMLTGMLSSSQTSSTLASSVSSLTNEMPKEKNSIDQAVMLTGMLSSSQTSSTIASSVSSLTNEIPKEKNEPVDSGVVLKKSVGSGLDDFSNEHVQSAIQKDIKMGVLVTSVASPEHQSSSKISNLDLEKQGGDKNVACEVDVKDEHKLANITREGHAMSTEESNGVLVSSQTPGSSLTNEIPTERDNPADSSNVFSEKGFIFGLDHPTDGDAQSSTQKLVNSEQSVGSLVSLAHQLFSKPSNVYLEKQGGNKNVVLETEVKTAAAVVDNTKVGHKRSTTCSAASVHAYAQRAALQSTMKKMVRYRREKEKEGKNWLGRRTVVRRITSA